MEQILSIGTIFGFLKIVAITGFLYLSVTLAFRFFHGWQKEGDKSVLFQKAQLPFFAIAVMALLLASLFYIEPILLRPQSTMEQENRPDTQVTKTLEERADVEIPPAQYDGELEKMEDELSSVKEDFKALEPVDDEDEDKEPE